MSKSVVRYLYDVTKEQYLLEETITSVMEPRRQYTVVTRESIPIGSEILHAKLDMRRNVLEIISVSCLADNIHSSDENKDECIVGEDSGINNNFI